MHHSPALLRLLRKQASRGAIFGAASQPPHPAARGSADAGKTVDHIQQSIRHRAVLL
jgi:hypothetical protein